MKKTFKSSLSGSKQSKSNPKLRKKLTLKWKVFGYLLGFCALLLIVLWLFQTVFLDSFYKSIKVTEVKNTADVVSENIDSDGLSDVLSSISENNDIEVIVTTVDGAELFSSPEIEGSLFNVIKNLISSAFQNNGEYYEYTTASFDKKPDDKKSDIHNDFADRFNGFPNKAMQSLMYVKIVESQENNTVAVIVKAVISPVNATVKTLRYQLYFITCIMIVLAIFLAIIISAKVSKPIEDITKSAKRLAGGNYDAYFGGEGFSEIVELSETLNTMESELSKVEELRRELMANISHDLRTPLSLIFSYAEMMHDFPNEITSEQTQMIMDEAQRLAALVNDVFDISRLETGNQTLSLKSFNITKSLESTTKRIFEMVKNDGYIISFVADQEVSVYADEVRITQVFYNLLINAINYSGTNKIIQINQTVSRASVRISVSDNGDGIPEESLPYIWDRYYRVDKTHRRAVTGTGLGLSIVKKTIELHNGRYGVESKLDEGSIFWFELPLEKK